MFSKSATFETKERQLAKSIEMERIGAIIPDHQVTADIQILFNYFFKVWNCKRLKQFLDENVGENIFENYLKAEIENIILDVNTKNAALCEQIDGCFELFGADIGKAGIIENKIL